MSQNPPFRFDVEAHRALCDLILAVPGADPPIILFEDPSATVARVARAALARIQELEAALAAATQGEPDGGDDESASEAAFMAEAEAQDTEARRATAAAALTLVEQGAETEVKEDEGMEEAEEVGEGGASGGDEGDGVHEE